MTIEQGTVTWARGRRRVTIRPGGPEDHRAISELLLAAYGQYQGMVSPHLWRLYLADLLDLDRHARFGQLVVAEVDGQLLGSGAFYPDGGVQGFGWPSGWAGGRGLAVHPSARGQGVAAALLRECERLARRAAAPVFAFHTAEFMSTAMALYERLRYRRSPEFDLDLNHYYGVTDAVPIRALAYRRDLEGVAAQ